MPLGSTVLGLVLLGGPLLILLAWVRQFVKLFPAPATSMNEIDLPRAVVVLSLRGADPSLADCLEGLLAQNYPHFEVRIVIDNLEDPSWKIVRQVLSQFPEAKARTYTLAAPRRTCSLKLSALLQALGDLDDSCEVVALIDADVIPHRNWLRDLVAPMSDPTVGAVTGIRWYAPDGAEWGSLVRQVWNSTASVVMYALNIPWGGSLAFRAAILRHSDVLDRWSLSLFEDTGFLQVVSGMGLKLRFAPAATMLNQESTTLDGCYRFIRRQMLNTRLYHGGWPVIFLHGLAFCLAPVVAFGALVASVLLGRWLEAACLVSAQVLAAALMGATLVTLERRVRGDVGSQVSWKMAAAIPLTLAVYLASLLSAAVMRRVDWRGIIYELRGPWKVKLVKYQPYRPAAGLQNASNSVV
jgi:hypothetical protein